MVTKAQRDALAWLIGHGHTSGIRGGSFIPYYSRRWVERFTAEEGEKPSWGASTGRQHAWRRTGGRLLAGMEASGLVKLERFAHGVPEYRITDAGREAVA